MSLSGIIPRMPTLAFGDPCEYGVCEYGVKVKLIIVT